jgi:hypothetical protein
VTLAVTGNTIPGHAVWRQRMWVSPKHRLSFIRSRWNIRWQSGREKTPTLCVFPVITVAVIKKFCDACGDGEYYFLSGCLAS